MTFDKKNFVDLLKLTDLRGLKEKEHFFHLFSLVTLNFCLQLDSNPGPRAWQSVTLSTIPNCLLDIFLKNFECIFTIFLRQSCQLDRVAIGDFVWKVVNRFTNFTAKFIIKVTKIII